MHNVFNKKLESMLMCINDDNLLKITKNKKYKILSFSENVNLFMLFKNDENCLIGLQIGESMKHFTTLKDNRKEKLKQIKSNRITCTK